METGKIKRKGFFAYLEEWLSYQKVEVILTGISLIITAIILYIHYKDEASSYKTEMTEAAQYKKEAEKYQNEIKSIIANEILPSNYEEHPNVKLIYDFNMAIQNCIIMYESINQAPNLSDIIDDSDDFDKMIEYWNEQQCEYVKTERGILLIIKELVEYGIKNDLDYYPNSKLNMLVDLGEAQVRAIDLAMEQSLNEMTNLIAAFGSHKYKPSNSKEMEKFKKYKQKCVKPIDQIRTNTNYYEFEKCYYDFVTDMTSKYASSLKKYAK